MTFKKGNVPWNKNLKGIQKAWNKREDLREKADAIIDLYENKLMNVESIGQIYGCDKYVIKRILKEQAKSMSRSNRRKILIKNHKIKVWNDGLNIEDERVKLNCEKRDKTMKEKHLYGGMKGRKNPRGSLAKLGNKNPMYGKFKELHPKFGTHPSLETMRKYKESRKNWVTPKKDTTIEVKIQEYLKRLGIEFFTHQYIKEIEHGYQCDILIPSMNLVIECFGTYWHKYPLSREIDIIRCKELKSAGYKVLVFWENEIRAMQIEDLKNKLETIRF